MPHVATDQPRATNHDARAWALRITCEQYSPRRVSGSNISSNAVAFATNT